MMFTEKIRERTKLAVGDCKVFFFCGDFALERPEFLTREFWNSRKFERGFERQMARASRILLSPERLSLS